jgi:hypothetical protein
MSKKIYVITDGDYSDYHIRAIFSNKETAEEYQRVSKASRCEEWVLDEIDVADLRGKTRMFGRITNDGRIHDIDENREDGQYGKTYYGFDCNGDMYLAATVKDKEALIKILNDTRASKIAEGTWEKDEEVV